jgi:hypothetical protein
LASRSSAATAAEAALAGPAPPPLSEPAPFALRPLILAGLVYLAIAAVLLWPAIVGGQVLSPAGLWTRTGPFPAELRERVPPGVDILSDSTYAYVPFLRYAADHLAQDGRLPLWKSTATCGAPFVGNGESAVFYPTVLLAILIGAPPWVHAATALMKLVAAGLSAYVLARYLRLSWLAAVLCGAIYALGGFQSVYLLFTPTNVSLLLPLMIVCADRLVLAPSGLRALLVAALAALQHLGGHPETAFHCQVLVAVLGVLRAWRLEGAAVRVAALAGSLVAGVGLAAFQVLPLAEYILNSDMLFLRRYAHAPIPVLRPWPTVGFLFEVALVIFALHRVKHARSPWLPAFVLCAAVASGGYLGLKGGMACSFAVMLSPDWLGDANHYLGPVNYVVANQGSAGVALPLVVLGLLYGRPRKLALGAGVLFAFGLLSGVQAPGLIQALGHLPLFSIAINSRLALYALLAIGVLAGLGLDALWRRSWPPGAPLRLSLATLAPAVGAWLALAIGAKSGLIAGSAPVRMPLDVPLEARLEPRASLERLWPGPAPGEGKLVYGWLAPSGKPMLVQALFNARHDNAVAECLPLPDADRAALKAPAQRPVYAFRVRLPDAKVVPGPTKLRVWASVAGGTRPEVSDIMQAPDDPGLGVLPFPGQPASGWLDPQLVLGAAVLLIAFAGLVSAGAVRWLRPAAAIVVSAGLALSAAQLLPFLPPELHYPPPPALELLASSWPDGRMLQMEPHIFAAELPTYYGLYDVRGYDALYPRRTALMLRTATNYPNDFATVDFLPRRNDVDLVLLGLMAVEYITDWHSPPPGLERLHYAGEKSLSRHDPFPVHVNPCFLPRARLVSGAVVMDDDEAALAFMRSDKFPRDKAVVLTTGETRKPAKGPAGTARIAFDQPDRVRVEVDPALEGWLVLSDSHFPGWRAFVDGEERLITRANVAFRAVAVRPGDHQVEFRYEPLSFRAGRVLAIVCVAVVLLWSPAARGFRRRRGTGPARMPHPPAPPETVHD